MSQHAELFFPEREWPVEEDILHTVSDLPVFLYLKSHQCGSFWGFFRCWMRLDKAFQILTVTVENCHLLLMLILLSAVLTILDIYNELCVLRAIPPTLWGSEVDGAVENIYPLLSASNVTTLQKCMLCPINVDAIYNLLLHTLPLQLEMV